MPGNEFCASFVLQLVEKESKIMFRKTLVAAAVAASLIAPAVPATFAATAPSVVVTDGWVRASSYSDHVDGMTGVFGKITNKTKNTVTLVGGSSSFAPMVQVHQVVNGMMSEKKGGIKIAPGKSVTLQPGGLHVMLMGLKQSILPGTKVDVKLSFTGIGKPKPVSLSLLSKTANAGDEEYFSNK
jgi:copper(I)-binding protein